MDNENYDDEWDDHTFLNYLAEYGFSFSQNGDGSEFIILKGWSRGGLYDNWYYSLNFTNDNSSKCKCSVNVEYNHKHTNNKYTYGYVNNKILPTINSFIDEFGFFNKYKIITFCVNLMKKDID